MIVDVIIVGAGMAGLTAAIYARRANKTVLVLEKKVAGGQIVPMVKIGNYPGFLEIDGAGLMKKVLEQAVNLGAEIRYEEVSEIVDGKTKKVRTDEGEHETKAVILAVGAEEKKLGLEREGDLDGVSYCATCDGALFKDQDVMVVGGGNTALYSALYLCDIAKKVYLVHRRQEFRGDAMLVEKLQKKGNVEMKLGTTPAELMGDTKLQGVKLDNGDTIEVTGLFVAVGRGPETEKFAKLVDLDENGYIVTGEDCHTSAEGIYAAGDCRTKSLRQLVTAAADGAMAATELVKNLK